MTVLADNALSSPAEVIARLTAIDEDLATRQNEYESAAGEVHRLIRDFELRVAQGKRVSSASTETGKKDDALIAIAASDDDLYSRLTDAEDRYESMKAAIRVIENRASVLQSVLRAQRGAA